MNNEYLSIPKLGIKTYSISEDRQEGCGTCDKGHEYVGIGGSDDCHYLVNLDKLAKSTNEKEGILIPQVAYRLGQINKSANEANVEKVTDLSILEMIAEQVN